ncbi:transcription termination factor Rho [Candidatus Cytomitobacter indipagum]|uniref:Transcription termination factor Rho n=1 Tax=Candidatus Cytomitobacter indipagum TaxID=2601575 RepID=A0A5C0UEU8_9PROT|nr:transcription termination factor Rho [Candidatus Cytomitobacter indipagum]
MDLCKLRERKNTELVRIAESLNLNLDEIKNKDLLLEILKEYSVLGNDIKAEGTLEVINDGYGFIRFASEDYTFSDDDIHVHQQFISRFNLKPGDSLEVNIKIPENNKNYSVKRIISINSKPAKRILGRLSFESLTALYPDRKMKLETEDRKNLSLRTLDCITPIGFGQRALIVAPPRTGKTILLQDIANAIHQNHKDVELMVLLIGERPEEVTDMKRSVHGEVISSTFDEPATRHVKVSEVVIEKAKRMVEDGKDVVILMDSITRLARAYNNVIPSSGKVLTGGVDAHALQYPKKFFGAARNIEEGGSLTIIATALVDTGSRMDEVIFEEFKGTGNADIILDRKAADKRIFPALDILKSGTRKEELLRNEGELSKIWLIRRIISEMNTVEALEFLLDKIHNSKDNDHFFRMMNS